jgi:hypothetical protein
MVGRRGVEWMSEWSVAGGQVRADHTYNPEMVACYLTLDDCAGPHAFSIGTTDVAGTNEKVQDDARSTPDRRRGRSETDFSRG